MSRKIYISYPSFVGVIANGMQSHPHGLRKMKLLLSEKIEIQFAGW